MEALKGIDGLASTKRLIALILAIGMLLVAGLAIYLNPLQAATLMWPLGSVISVALGATAFERIGIKK